MIKRMIFILLCAISILNAQNIIVNKYWLIGNDENKGDEYLFSKIKAIVCGQNGKFYVVEDGIEIKEFSGDGVFIKKIGRLGSGPGEFKSITSLTVNANNQLVIFDEINNRYSIIPSSFDTRLIKTIVPANQEQPKIIYSMTDNNYIFIDNVGLYTNAEILFMISSDLKKLIQKKYYLKDFVKDKDNRMEILARKYLKIAQIKKNLFCVYNELYDGSLVLISINNNNMQIKKNTQNIYSDNGVSIIDKSEFEDFSDLSYKVYFSSTQKLYLKIKRKCIGITNYLDKNMFVFYFETDRKGNSTLKIDIYDFDGKFIGTKQIEKMTHDCELYNAKIYSDQKNDFIFTFDKDMIPVIQKLKIQLVK